MPNAFFAVLSTEGRVVGLCWVKLKPKGPKGPPAEASVLEWKTPAENFGCIAKPAAEILEN